MKLGLTETEKKYNEIKKLHSEEWFWTTEKPPKEKRNIGYKLGLTIFWIIVALYIVGMFYEYIYKPLNN